MEDKLIRYLAGLPLFEVTPSEILVELAGRIKTGQLDKDDILIHEGTPSNSLFVIRTGWVKIIATNPAGEEVVLNQLGPGQVIGEMSLIEQLPRSNTVKAVSPVTFLEIEYDVVLDLLDRHPTLAVSLLRSMSERVRFANAYIEEVVNWCQQISQGNYEFVEEQVARTQSTIVDLNKTHQARASAFLSAFFQMVRQVKDREEALKKEVHQLKIEIDEAKRQRAVKELTETEFFEQLQESAKRMREQRRKKQAK